MASRVDERGRIVLPKRLRERLGLEPGRRVRIEEIEGGVVVRVEQNREQTISRLRGAIHSGNRDPDATPLDPLDVKRMWEPKV